MNIIKEARGVEKEEGSKHKKGLPFTDNPFL